MTAAFQTRLLDELVPEKMKITGKEEPAIAEDILSADGSKVAARLPAVETAVVKTSAQNVNTPDWRGTCAICLDLLPEGDGLSFYLLQEAMHGMLSKMPGARHALPALPRVAPPTSTAEVVRRLQKHADKGNADAHAQYFLGDSYIRSTCINVLNVALGHKQNYKLGAQLYERAAAQGHTEAQTKLGHCYEYRLVGVKINYKTAEQWYRRAAEQGYSVAQNNFGTFFYEGRGVPQSFDEAVKWYRLAAAQGHAFALCNLGMCHEYGNGVSQDDNEALRLYKSAAALGYAHAGDRALGLGFIEYAQYFFGLVGLRLVLVGVAVYVGLCRKHYG